ncbi:MAG: hypothetical protein ABIX01_17795 [Chitinophagaceae bacterium]
MKSFRYLLLTAVTLASLESCFLKHAATAPANTATIVRPAPIGEDEEELNNRRENWWKLIHKADSATDWKMVESANRENLVLVKKQRLANRLASVAETFAGGNLVGSWSEKGSINQAGSVIGVDFDQPTNTIYAVSSGGSLWKGALTTNSWTLLNDDQVFDNANIKVFNKTGGGRRILVSHDLNVYFSDNEGASFTASTGISFPVGWGGNFIAQIVMPNDATNNIYVLTRPWDNTAGNWSPRFYLYRSTNQGATFTRIAIFTGGDDYNVRLVAPYNSAGLYAIDTKTTANSLAFWQVSGSAVTLLNSFACADASNKALLKGVAIGGTTTFYTLLNQNKLYRSTNFGASWTLQSTLPDNSWDRLDVSNVDAAKVFFGSVNAYRSYNSGVSWTMVNVWSDYYGNVAGKLHADIMAIEHFYKQDGTPLAFVNNHGGVAVSYDELTTTLNLSQANLNSSQYYDILTDPDQPNNLFAGSQDQGFQRSTAASISGGVNFTQVISGDYGYLCLSGYPKHLWTQYPGGALYYYNSPTSGVSSTWTMPGSTKPNYGWMLPMVNTNHPEFHETLMGGGNLSGGSGSYLCKVTSLTSSPYTISATQYPFDFRANSTSTTAGITAICSSQKDSNNIYVATEDGSFFYSSNKGSTWTKTSSFSGPGPWYLYGSTICASKITSGLLWYGGSGYSNPGVYKSINGGVSFTAMNTGLPSTLVHEIVGNPTETLLFAATDAGPYVYVVANNTWYPIIGGLTPIQPYVSVEYIVASNTVRFGTFGRGIWDFSLTLPSMNLCQNGTGVLTANLTGTNYQWQVNTGSGFANLTDGGNYSGANTARLQLLSIPSDWYGYQYRCLVDGNNGNVSAVRFSAYWNGSVNNNWETAGNWSCGVLPDIHTDVYINAGTLLVNSNGSCRSLNVKPGVNMKVNANFTLTVANEN